ncbi:MAG: hypothetical protein ACOZQL_35005 [Myxococcota bacterium]
MSGRAASPSSSHQRSALALESVAASTRTKCRMTRAPSLMG